MTFLKLLNLNNTNISGALNKDKITGTAAISNIDNAFTDTQTLNGLKDTKFLAGGARSASGNVSVGTSDFTINCTNQSTVTLPYSTTTGRIINVSTQSIIEVIASASKYRSTYGLSVTNAASTSGSVSKIYFQGTSSLGKDFTGYATSVNASSLTSYVEFEGGNYKNHFVLMGTSYAKILSVDSINRIIYIDTWINGIPSANNSFIVRKMPINDVLVDDSVKGTNIASSAVVTATAKYLGTSSTAVDILPPTTTYPTKAFTVSQAPTFSNGDYICARPLNVAFAKIHGTATYSGSGPYTITMTPTITEYDIIDSGTTTSAPNSTTLTDSSKVWEVNAFAQTHLIRCGSSHAMIASNTETQITISGSWNGGTPASGAYEICFVSELLFTGDITGIGPGYLYNNPSPWLITGTVLSANATSLTDNSVNFPASGGYDFIVNRYVGYNIVAKNSSNADTIGTITSQLNPTFTVSSWSNGIPAANTTFKIVWAGGSVGSSQWNGHIVKAFRYSTGTYTYTTLGVTSSSQWTSTNGNQLSLANAWTGGTPAVGDPFDIYKIPFYGSTLARYSTAKDWVIDANTITLNNAVTGIIAPSAAINFKNGKVAVASGGLIDGSSLITMNPKDEMQFQFKGSGSWIKI